MKLSGLIAAPHTPFNPDYSINLDAVAKQAAHLAENGVSGAFVAGTTGECHSLTTAERTELFKVWGTVASQHGLKFIAHTGHNNLPDAQLLAEAAKESGADAYSAMAPNFFKPSDAGALLEWFQFITEPAQDLPFYFYDIPGFTGVTIDTAEFVRLAAKQLPGFVGVKYTNPDREQLRSILAADDAPDMLWGCDEELYDGLELGCKGAVGSSYNFAAPIYHRVMEAFQEGNLDETRLWQKRSWKMIETIAAHGYMHSAKTIMSWIGVDCGPARPPLPRSKDSDQNTLRAKLEALGFFDWIT
ncbi:MAG: dihydrodipicolinate synthase family protein [Opitutae bacterium]